jgi:hypothetical protein
MIYEDIQIPEIYYMKHRHDNDTDYVDYENKLLDNTLSPYLYNNDMMNSFLKKLQKLVAILFDQHNVIKNFKNYNVHKYYFKNKN